MARPSREQQIRQLFRKQIEYSLLIMSVSEVMHEYRLDYELVHKIKQNMRTTRTARRCTKAKADHAA